MNGFSQKEQAERLYGLGEIEAELLEVLRLVVRQTERAENLDADLASGREPSLSGTTEQ